MKHLAPFIWLAYLVVPIEGWGLFHGRPLGGFAAVALVALCWLWWVRRSLPFPVVAVAALVAKIALGATLLAPRGFDARYYANADFAGAPETGTEPARGPFTRTDTRLSFAGPGDDDLPVYFLNDSSRFNFYLPNQPARATLPVSVMWEGWLRVTRTGLQRLYVRTAGARVVMAVGDGFSASIPSATTEWVGYPNLTTGFQRIKISLSIPPGGARRFEAGWTVDGRQEPFDTGVIFRKPMTTAALAADWLLRAISTAFDLMVCGWLFVGVLRAFGAAWHRLVVSAAAGDALKLAWAAVAVDALLFAGPMLHKMVTLSGGDDWLSYETRARDIGLHGLWMLGGASLGHGAPFYQFPLYPYFLAAAHWVFGDDLYGVYLVQRLLAAGSAITLWRMTAALFGEQVGGAGLLTAFVIVYEKVAPWTGVVLTELLFGPLVCVWALLLVRLACSPRPDLRSASIAGAVGGLATLARSTLLAGWALVLPLVTLALFRTRRAGRIMVLLVVTLVAVTSLATARNWVVARKFVVVSSHGPVTFYLNNTPSAPVRVPAEHKAAYDRWGFDPYVQIVIEYARQRPRVFFEKWRQRAAYALGSFATLAPDQGRSGFYMMASSAALVGLLWLMVRRPWLPGRGLASFIPFSLALAHLVPLVVSDSSTYGDRLLLPFYALLVPYVGIVAFGAHRALWRLAGPRMGLWMWLGLAGVSAWRLLGGVPGIDLSVTVLAVLLWGVCVYGVPRLSVSAAAVYGALAVGLCTWAAVRGTAGAELAVRMDLLLLVTALGSRVMMTGLSRLRLPETPPLAWIGVVITVLTLAALHQTAAGVPVVIMAGLVLGLVQPLSPPVRTALRVSDL